MHSKFSHHSLSKEGLNIVDLLVLIIVLLSGTLAYFRGLVRESISIAGWIISALLAFNFANQVEPMLRSAPLIGEYLKKSCDISIILTFVLLFTVCLVIFSILAPFLSSVIKRTYLKSIDRFFGFLFGLARGALIIIVLFIKSSSVRRGGTLPNCRSGLNGSVNC